MLSTQNDNEAGMQLVAGLFTLYNYALRIK